MTVADPSEAAEFNRAMRERIIACGAVPLADDLFAPETCNILHRQLIFLLNCGGGGGGGGSFYSRIAIDPGTPGIIDFHAWGAPFAGVPAFGPAAPDFMQPALLLGPGNFGIQLPAGAVAVFSIPPAALAPVGWIDAIALVAGGGTSYSIAIATNLIGLAATTLVSWVITAGAITIDGAFLIDVVVP